MEQGRPRCSTHLPPCIQPRVSLPFGERGQALASWGPVISKHLLRPWPFPSCPRGTYTAASQGNPGHLPSSMLGATPPASFLSPFRTAPCQALLQVGAPDRSSPQQLRDFRGHLLGYPATQEPASGSMYYLLPGPKSCLGNPQTRRRRLSARHPCFFAGPAPSTSPSTWTPCTPMLHGCLRPALWSAGPSELAGRGVQRLLLSSPLGTSAHTGVH